MNNLYMSVLNNQNKMKRSGNCPLMSKKIWPSRKVVTILSALALCSGITSGVFAEATETEEDTGYVEITTPVDSTDTEEPTQPELPEAENTPGKGYGISFGTGAIAEEPASIAIGIGSTVKGAGNYGIAIGGVAHASGSSSLAIGNKSNAESQYSISIGEDSHAKEYLNIAIGYGSNSSGLFSTTIGAGAVSDGYLSVAQGNMASSGGELSMAMGSLSEAPNYGSVALGTLAVAKADNSMALGTRSVAVVSDDISTKAYLTDEVFSKENGIVSVGNTEYVDGFDETIAENHRRITNVAGGADDYDAVNIAQLKKLESNVNISIKDITNKINNINGSTGESDGTRDFSGDDGASNQVSVKLGETMNLKGGADVTNLSDGNIGVVTNSNKDGFDIKLSKDIKGLNSVTTGNTTMNNNGLTIKNEDSSKNITIQNNNVSMGGNVITNIGEGTNPTDAINKNQFDREISQINNGMGQVNNRISNLDNRVDRVGAGAAALAALHPLDFDPTSRWEVSAGVGNYRGANAVAVGAFYRPNYDTMISLGSSYGGGENMINAGVTFRIGEGTTKVYSSQDTLAREVDSLRSLVDEQNRKLESQSKQLTAQNNKIESQSEQLAAQNNKLEVQNSKIEAQSRQLESQGKQLQEQSRQIAQLMQAVAELKK